MAGCWCGWNDFMTQPTVWIPFHQAGIEQQHLRAALQ